MEHCTALIEDRAGYLHLIHWSDHGRVDASDVSQEAAGKPAPALPPELAWLCTPSANVS